MLMRSMRYALLCRLLHAVHHYVTGNGSARREVAAEDADSAAATIRRFANASR